MDARSNLFLKSQVGEVAPLEEQAPPLNFGYTNKVPVLLQTESSECGLACLAMIAGFHGFNVGLRSLRQRFHISLKGATLTNLIKIAGQLQLSARAVRIELEEVKDLRMPCILHWNMGHFVVLTEATERYAVIHDPSHGRRRVQKSELSRAFTGIALELWPKPDFRLLDEERPVRLRSLMGKVTGLKRSFFQILFLAASLEALSLLTPFLMQWTIDEVVVGADKDLLVTLLFGFALLLVFQQAISGVRSWVLMFMGTNLNVQWRANVFTHLLRLPTQYFGRRHVGDIVSRFGAVDAIQQTLTTSFLAAILDGVMATATLVLMFVYSPLLGAVALGAMTFYAAGRAVWYAPLRDATQDQIVRGAKTQSHFLESIRGIRSIQLFQRQYERRNSWLTLLVEQVNAGLHTQKIRLVYGQWNGFLFGAESLLSLWLGASMVISGEFSVGMLVAFNSYKGSFSSRVGSLVDKYFEVKMLQLQAQRLADIVHTEPEDADIEWLEHSDESATNNFTGDIEFHGVEFRYAHGEKTIIDGVSLSIKSGSSVALVGPSGCGKTTMINLLLAIVQPTQGFISIGGRKVESLGKAELRSLIGVVMQDDVLFAGTVKENISFFSSDADQTWIEQCARVAGVHDEIAEMPMGYGTLVGDMGSVLSGGQKQRILIARALYKRPQVLVLDEATSHLDVLNERRINQEIKNLNITRVIVAHRPETISSADRVINLYQGKIVRDGVSRESDFVAAAS